MQHATAKTVRIWPQEAEEALLGSFEAKDVQWENMGRTSLPWLRVELTIFTFFFR